ncbi:hypothetical protein [Paeniglutamicibacter sp. NPDC091659]|uniref:hypothetical protein n=1 Tax=Paeniglutamicibacter sp. NPDC091659 TaxID=3364389 RepID=UPI00382FA072
MPDSDIPAPTAAAELRPQSPTATKPRWGLRIGLGAAGLALLAAAFLLIRLFLPVWWATRIANQTQGSLSGGLLLGLTYGFAFTFVPLVIAWQARYKKISWPWKWAIIGVAVLAALPNLLTLGIYLNSSGAAQKARLMIDTSAIWFPSWSIGGAAAGALLFAGIATFWHMWRSRGRKLKSLRREVQSRAAAGSKPAISQGATTGVEVSGPQGDAAGDPGSGPDGNPADEMPPTSPQS